MTTPQKVERQIVSIGRERTALEYGSPLSLSYPRACSRVLPSQRDLPASKLAEAKAAASCRTPKLCTRPFC